MKRVVLNVATGTRYPPGQTRLLESLPEDTETMTWTDEFPPGSPTHTQVPYAFKCYAFLVAIAQGYDQALWLDSSVVLNKPLSEIWDYVDEDGYCFGIEGWTVGQWINDKALGILDLTRQEAWDISLMEGKVIGLDFHNDLAMEWFNAWLDYMEKGAFNGSWDDHRHDISVGAVVANRLGMKLRTSMISFLPNREGHFLALGC